ncbi:MAG: biosynthetic-type acetolactate synthase large subunit [Nitrospirota bacterium]
MKKKGSEIFVEALKKEKVKTIFGIPGGVVLGLYDTLYNHKEIEVILTRHEQGAAHAADGYARAAGKPGVALVTSGPGATNTVTGLANAYMDSIPIIVFTGQVATNLIGNDAFQEADIVGISRPCTKYNYLVKDVNELDRVIKEAFYIAATGRPGPVLIDLPKDVSQNMGEFNHSEKVNIRGYNPKYQGNKWQIKVSVDAVLQSKRPVIYAGGGVINSNASEELKAFAESTHIPVCMTLTGLGGFPGTHNLSLGMLGMHGMYCANMAIHNSDLIIAIGSRFDDRVTGKISKFAPSAKIIHIDIDPTSIRKNVNVDIPIVGDVKAVLKEVNKILKEKGDTDSEEKRKPWLKQVEKWKREKPLFYKNDEKVIKPQYVIQKIYEITKGDAIITTEVGQNQMWAAQHYKFDKPRTFITSGGLGTMGFGFPAAIGAQKAFPNKLVIDIAGDGSIQMNIQELATAVIYKLPVKIAILNNGYLGMVRQWQQLFYDRRYSSSFLEPHPDFVKLAEAYNVVGLRAVKPDEVEGVIREAIRIPGPVVMDFQVAPEENVYPMVPAGCAINEMIFEDPPVKRKEKKESIMNA